MSKLTKGKEGETNPLNFPAETFKEVLLAGVFSFQVNEGILLLEDLIALTGHSLLGFIS